ncbi:aldehyde dehydrogenase family protein [Streptomyces sp. NPDC003697]
MSHIIEQLVGGRWVGADAPARTENLNPADQRDVIGDVAMLSAGQAASAVAAAADALPGWRRTSAVQRGVILARAADLLRERRDDIAGDVSRENGKTPAEARVEVDKSADFLDFYAGAGRLPYGELLSDVREGAFVMTVHEPVGVVVAVTPWNDPLLTPARKISPALVAGNTVVVKPSLETPLAMQHLARALHDAGLPAGVLNTVTAANDVIESHVLADPRVAAVTVTGSTATGQALQRRLAGRGIRFQAEMGGKNAAVVLADADLDLAAATIAAAGFAQAGQRCTATSRVLVHRDVHDRLVELLVAAARSHRLGAGSADGTTLGPLVSRRQQASVLKHVQQARDHGAEVRYGGDAPSEGDLSHGCFVTPAVVTGVKPDTPLWRDEVFGPVLAVAAFDNFRDAVADVNDSPYGLSASVFTRDLSAAHRFIEEVDAGQVAVNLPTSGWDVHHPFGGFKESGSAFKEQGADALRFYLRVKTAAVGHTRAGS